MKKNLIFLSAFTLVALVACDGASLSTDSTNSESSSGTPTITLSDSTNHVLPDLETPDIVYPSGTPAIGLANYLVNHIDTSTVAESTGIVAELSKEDGAEIVVAPVNIGVKVYNEAETYKLFKTFVWGNLYVISHDSTITDFNSLDGKEVYYFGNSSATPYVIASALASYNDIDINLVQGGSTAGDLNSFYKAGTYNTIITAEPILSSLKATSTDMKTIIDLQEEYEKMNGTSSYPQAGVFVRKDVLDNYNTSFLDEISAAVIEANEDPETTSQNAKLLPPFEASPTAQVLKDSIPGSHFGLVDTYEEEMAAVNSYLEVLGEQGLGATYGNKKPTEEFYIH